MKTMQFRKIIVIALSMIFLFSFSNMSYAVGDEINFESLPINTFIVGEKDAYSINSPNFKLMYIVGNTFNKTSNRSFYMKSPFKHPETQEGMWFNILDGSVKNIADLMNPAKAISNDYLQALELDLYNNPDGQAVSIINNTTPQEPSVTTSFTPDALLGNGFSLGKLTANVKGVTGATKYAVKYSVSNETETKYVTTAIVNNGQATTDLVQYKAGKTIIDILVYNASGSEIYVFEKITIK